MDATAYAFFMDTLQSSIKPSTGCTEPAAIALNAATARKHAQGTFQRLFLRVDEFLYKNAMGVGLPGTRKRGVAMCAALGITAGDADAGINVLHHVTEEMVLEAERMVRDKLVTVEVCGDCDTLYVQSTLITDVDSIRVTTTEQHDNIIEIGRAPFASNCVPECCLNDAPILSYSLRDMVDFIEAAEPHVLAFLEDGVQMNLAVAAAGEQLAFGRAMRALLDRGLLGDSPISEAKVLCACASYARMAGVPLPVMTATGSGNQGITVTMTVEGAARSLQIAPDVKLRGLALAHLINVYGKANMGNLSALCACGVSSGLGASVAVVYMLGGTPDQMLLAAQNMLGSICGMICDGAKEGCANKVELSAGLAVQSALLALENVGIPDSNGILSGEWKTLFSNLGALARDGMRETNRVIVRLMQREGT